MLIDPESAKNTVMLSVSFYVFGICVRKSCTKNVDEIEPSNQRKERQGSIYFRPFILSQQVELIALVELTLKFPKKVFRFAEFLLLFSWWEFHHHFTSSFLSAFCLKVYFNVLTVCVCNFLAKRIWQKSSW